MPNTLIWNSATMPASSLIASTESWSFTNTKCGVSLAEEADALRSVVMLATGDKKVKSLTPSLAKLKKLNDDGLLEAYVLIALADKGIATDHPDYLKQHRDKLRRYVVEYVLTGGGK